MSSEEVKRKVPGVLILFYIYTLLSYILHPTLGTLTGALSLCSGRSPLTEGAVLMGGGSIPGYTTTAIV